MLKQLREFSLDHHDFPTLARNLATILRWLTLNIDSGNNKRIPIIYYLGMWISLLLYIYGYIVSSVWLIFFRDADDAKLIKLITFSQCITTMGGAAKFMNMYFKKYELMGLIDAYLACDSRVVPDSRLSKNINATLRIVKKRALVVWLAVIGNIIIYIVMRPLLVPDRLSLKDYQHMWGLDPVYESPNYEITMVVITGVIPVVVFGPVHITIFLMVVVGYSEAQMKALSKELLSLWDDTETDYHNYLSETDRLPTTLSVDDLLRRRLESILKSHAMNNQLILQVESVFSTGIAFQLLMLSIALVALLVAGLKNVYTTVPFLSLLVYMDCYTGQNLIDASKEFEAAVYRCQWEKFDKNNKRLVLMMLQNAQKMMKLSAGGVFSVDYSRFMYIVKSIYQMYAALRPNNSEFQI